LALVLKYGIGDFIGIMEEKEKLEHDLSEVLVMANKIIVDVSILVVQSPQTESFITAYAI
jgi:hypothetical protein